MWRRPATEGRFAALLRGGGAADRVVDLVRCVTLLDLLLRPIGPWSIRPAVLALAGIGLIAPSVRRSPLTWAALTLLTAIRVALEWPVADNHSYLLSYWCLAQALACWSNQPAAVLAKSGRLLIGLLFALATLWKAFSPDYLDGRFFRVTLLTDERFADLTMLAGGMSRADLEETRSYLQPLPEGMELLDPPRLRETARLRSFATVLTLVSLGLEALVAVAFLVPGGRRILAARHAVLIGFCVATYAVAPVAGFAWLLLAMGLAQCRPEQRRLQATYLGVFFLVLFYNQVPWVRLLLDWRRA